jgi:leucyl aminopeptidase (aminopeptidase T)
MKKIAKAINAAQTIFADCLALPPSAKLIIFTDETTCDVANVLGETAVKMGLWPLTVYYTKQMQIELGEQVQEDQWEFLSTAAAVMICLNASEKCFPFRDHVRKAAWQAGCKVAHMPGIDLDILELAEVNYPVLQANCEILALALAKGRHIRIGTVDSLDRQYQLDVNLDPWMRLPIISDGIIQQGSWGNVPSGETFIAPPENQANGEIVIDGSVPGCVISRGKEIVLSFREGRLVDWQPRDAPAAVQLEQIASQYARENNDPGWDVLAEIGLGVNPRVETVTGNALLDEKKYGSLHVALGDNKDMGGSNESCIHCDMVSLRPRVKIDGLPILANGDLIVNQMDWREDYRTLSVPVEWDKNMLVRPTAIDTEVDAKSLLRRVWHTGSGRVCSVPVGDDESAKLAHHLYKRLKRNGKSESIGRITHFFSTLPGEDVLRLIHLLQRYSLVSVIEQHEGNGIGDEK